MNTATSIVCIYIVYTVHVCIYIIYVYVRIWEKGPFWEMEI